MLNSWSESFRPMISECPPWLLSVTPPLRSLEINPNMLGRWIKEHESVDGQTFRGNFKLTAEQLEIRQLREENHRLKMAKDILKKATVDSTWRRTV
jgi:transposase-like protein